MDSEIVRRAAFVAHLKLSDEEIAAYCDDFDALLERFQALDGIEGEDIEGFTPVPVEDVLREDVPSMDIPADELMKDMDTYDGYVRGPKIA